MNTKLILRTLTSPFPTPYSDITKGSVLSHADVDNNFIYLKGQTIYSAESVSQTVVLHKLNGDVIQFNVGSSGSTGTTGTTGIKNILRSTDDIIIEPDFQYLIYGDLTLDGGKLTNAGDVVIINGGLINNGGTYISSGGTLEMVHFNMSLDIKLINVNPSGSTVDIVTNSRYTYIKLVGDLSGDTFFISSDISNCQIGDILRIASKFINGHSYFSFFFDNNFYSTMCGGTSSPVEIEIGADAERDVTTFIFDGEKWVSTYDNC